MFKDVFILNLSYKLRRGLKEREMKGTLVFDCADGISGHRTN